MLVSHHSDSSWAVDPSQRNADRNLTWRLIYTNLTARANNYNSKIALSFLQDHDRQANTLDCNDQWSDDMSNRSEGWSMHVIPRVTCKDRQHDKVSIATSATSEDAHHTPKASLVGNGSSSLFGALGACSPFPTRVLPSTRSVVFLKNPRINWDPWTV